MQKNELVISIIIIILFAGAVIFILGSSGRKSNQTVTSSIAADSSCNTPPTFPETLLVQTTSQGTGTHCAQVGDSISVLYTGTLEDGTEFDSNVSSGSPYTLTLGEGTVIQGWELGLIGVKAGEKRKLTIPAELGYGETGSGEIPPGATLIFDVEIVNVTAGS